MGGQDRSLKNRAAIGGQLGCKEEQHNPRLAAALQPNAVHAAGCHLPPDQMRLQASLPTNETARALALLVAFRVACPSRHLWACHTYNHGTLSPLSPARAD